MGILIWPHALTFVGLPASIPASDPFSGQGGECGERAMPGSGEGVPHGSRERVPIESSEMPNSAIVISKIHEELLFNEEYERHILDLEVLSVLQFSMMPGMFSASGNEVVPYSLRFLLFPPGSFPLLPSPIRQKTQNLESTCHQIQEQHLPCCNQAAEARV